MSDLQLHAPSRSTSIGPALAASFASLRKRGVVTIGLGAAVVLSLLSVCCGLGLATTPWFMCELLAVQLALLTEQPVTRGIAFVPAGSILLGAVLMVSAVAWLTLLGAGAELPSEYPQLLRFGGLMKSGGAAALISSTLALLLVAPLLYAPLILIEQGTRVDHALAESVRLVVVAGAVASVRLSLCAHLVQAAPLLLAVMMGLLIDPSRMAWFCLGAALLMPISVPLGQGMIVWSYAQVRERLGAVPRGEPVPPALRPLSAWIHAWMALIALPIVALLLLEVSLVRPSRIPLGHAPEGELVAALQLSAHTEHVPLPATSLELEASSDALSVVASDGGGAGNLPLRAAAPIDRVRIVRVRDAFAIELQQAGESYVSWIDRAGVRLDDDLRARLLDRSSPLQLGLFLISLLATGLASVPVLNALGRVQRGYRLPEGRRPSQAALELDRERSLSRARNIALLLAPLGLACLILAVRAVVG
jgi:hypothetical protein